MNKEKQLYRLNTKGDVVKVTITPYYKINGLEASKGCYYPENELSNIIEKYNLVEYDKVTELKVKRLEEELGIKLQIQKD